MSIDVTGGILKHLLGQQVAFAIDSLFGQQPSKELHPRDSYILPYELVGGAGVVTSHGGLVYQT
jgi:hypothetical protein